MGLSGPGASGSSYQAYCFDEAILTWGNYVTNEVDKIDGKNPKAVERKRVRKLEQLIGQNETPEQKKARPQRFADPADLFK